MKKDSAEERFFPSELFRNAEAEMTGRSLAIQHRKGSPGATLPGMRTVWAAAGRIETKTAKKRMRDGRIKAAARQAEVFFS